MSGGPARPSAPRSVLLHRSAMRSATPRAGGASDLVRRTALGRGRTVHASWNGVASLHARGAAIRCSHTLNGEIRYEVEATVRLTGWTEPATPRAVEISPVRANSIGTGPRTRWARARTGGIPGAGRSESLRPGAMTTGKHGQPLVATGRLRGGQGLAANRGGQIRLTAGNETCSRRPQGGPPLWTTHDARRSLTLSSERTVEAASRVPRACVDACAQCSGARVRCVRTDAACRQVIEVTEENIGSPTELLFPAELGRSLLSLCCSLGPGLALPATRPREFDSRTSDAGARTRCFTALDVVSPHGARRPCGGSSR